MIERNLNNMFKKWHQKKFISDKELSSIRSSDSILPKAYALPKIHKESVLFRIIVTSIHTVLYSLASYLQDIISENILSAKSRKIV